jgi:phosphomannomutase
MFDPAQFQRKADFRGVYPDDLNEELAFHAGRYLVQYVAKVTDESSPVVLVGRDGRLSSPQIYRSLVEGIAAAHGQPICAELATTDMIQWGAGMRFHGAVAGAMVTASHNPSEYNGIKMVVRSPESGGISIIRPVAHLHPLWKDDQAPAEAAAAVRVPIPTAEPLTLHQDFVRAALQRVTSLKQAAGSLVLDPGNGVGAIFLPLLKQAFAELQVDVQLHAIFEDIDGRFPNRCPNPGLPGQAEPLQNAVRRYQAEFGAAFDGDADRVFLVDECGQFVPGSQLLGALAARALTKVGPGPVVFAAVCSFSVIDAIRRFGGTPIFCRVGQDSIKVAMMKTKAIFGGESSAHYNFPDTYYLDSGLFALMMFWDLLLESNETCSKALVPFACWNNSGEINLRMRCGDWQEMGRKIIDMLQTRFETAEANCYVTRLDGVGVYHPRVAAYPSVDDLFPIDRVEDPDGNLYRLVADDYRPQWWFNVRASNNEPLLRVNFEAQDGTLLVTQTLDLIESIRHYCHEHGAQLEVEDAGNLAIDLDRSV